MIANVVTRSIDAFNWLVLGYFVALNVVYLLVVVGALTVMIRSTRRSDPVSRDDIFANPLTPPVSVLIPAFNEQAGIVESVRGMLALHYPQLEVVVVDDGSTDDTFEVLRKEFDLVEVAPVIDAVLPMRGAVRSMHVPAADVPLVVVRKVNAGRRADALNVALNAARYPLVCMVDADSILDPDALLRVAQPFVDDPDRVVASGGAIRAANGSTVYRGQVVEHRQPHTWLERIQVIEYLRAFLVGRTGWSNVGGLLIISGAFGLFRREVIVDLGGLDADSLGEDADLVAGLHRHLRDAGRDYSVVFVPEPVCWTELPVDRRSLGRQRQRWSHGLVQVLWKQRRMMLNPRYGRVGMVVMPYYLVFELLGPVIEVLGLVAVVTGVALGVVDVPFALLLAVAALGYGILLSLAAIAVDQLTEHRPVRSRELLLMFLAAILENLGYRQVHAWWRLRGLVAGITGRTAAWGAMPRTGFVPAAPLREQTSRTGPISHTSAHRR